MCKLHAGQDISSLFACFPCSSIFQGVYSGMNSPAFPSVYSIRVTPRCHGASPFFCFGFPPHGCNMLLCTLPPPGAVALLQMLSAFHLIIFTNSLPCNRNQTLSVALVATVFPFNLWSGPSSQLLHHLALNDRHNRALKLSGANSHVKGNVPLYWTLNCQPHRSSFWSVAAQAGGDGSGSGGGINSSSLSLCFDGSRVSPQAGGQGRAKLLQGSYSACTKEFLYFFLKKTTLLAVYNKPLIPPQSLAV